MSKKLVSVDGNYCRDICGQSNSCKRLKDGDMCTNAKRYAMLQEYARVGLTPDEIREAVALLASFLMASPAEIVQDLIDGVAKEWLGD